MSTHIKKVKVTFPFKKPDIAKQLPSGCNNLGDFYFYINPDNDAEHEPYDYWVVYENLNKPRERTLLRNCGNSLFITGEPPSVKRYSNSFLKQFDLVITAHENMKHANALCYQQALPWTINKGFTDLKKEQEISKSKFMSIITSNKTLTDGHRKRLDFALKLKELFPEHIDLFGRGIKDFDDKWDVLAPYKYNICIENSSVTHYFTEKLVDSYLCLSFPLYYGCKNIEDYYDPQSFIKIDIDNIDACKNLISKLLNDPGHYNQKLPYLKHAKDKSLENYNLFPFIKSVVESQMHKEIAIPKEGCKNKKLMKAPLDIIKYYLKKVK